MLELAFGAQPVLARALESVAGIEAAALYGSYAARLAGEPGPAPADVDLLIVGTVDMSAVYDACRTAEQQLRREVNLTVLSPNEWRRGDSGFLRQLRGRPLRPVIGTLP